MSDGRIVDVTDQEEPKPGPKLSKKAVQKLLNTQPISVADQKSIPWIPKEPVEFGAISGHLSPPLERPANPKKSSKIAPNQDFPGVEYSEPTAILAKKERKQAPPKKRQELGLELEHQLEGNILQNQVSIIF